MKNMMTEIVLEKSKPANMYDVTFNSSFRGVIQANKCMSDGTVLLIPNGQTVVLEKKLAIEIRDAYPEFITMRPHV